MSSPDKRRTPLVLIGGGGHALVVADAARLAGFEVVGFLDDDPHAALGRLGESAGAAMRIGSLADLTRIADRSWIMGVGELGFRQQLLTRLATADLGPAVTVVHPSATVSPTAHIGPGVYVGPRAIVHTRVRVADHAIINSGAIVEHECIIEPNAHIAPGAVLGGGVRIGSGTLVGLGSRVLPRLSVGSGAVVGAGAVVVRSIGDHGRVVGVPARALPAH
jgi:sugar O-acyltransferase (sialic acid O-acetyltransferase NeuD family)